MCVWFVHPLAIEQVTPHRVEFPANSPQSTIFLQFATKFSISIDCKQGYKFKTRFRQSFRGGSVLEVWETSVYVAYYANIQNFYKGEKQ